VEDLRAHDGIRITAKEDLAGTLIGLIQDGASAKAVGLRARQVFDQQAGATERTVRALQDLLVTGSATL